MLVLVARSTRDGKHLRWQYLGLKRSRAMVIKDVKSNVFHDAGIGNASYNSDYVQEPRKAWQSSN